ncbi:hypothetical protein M0R45_018217 [Rubus argutus]|uniref:Uncharacterized protein n=1 Tax=Rubus argutus TaxID=59490 RepID=A0AAW1X4I1_RUBAR
MRHMILAIIQQRARESGLLVDLFSDDDDDETLQPQQANSDDNEILVDSDVYDLLPHDNESKDDETPQFGSQPKFDDDETLVDSVVLDLFYNDNNDKTPKFGPEPLLQQFKFDDETLEDCGAVDNLRLGALPPPQPAVSSTTKDEPQEISDSILEEKCSLISKFGNYLQGDDLLAKKLA